VPTTANQAETEPHAAGAVTVDPPVEAEAAAEAQAFAAEGSETDRGEVVAGTPVHKPGRLDRLEAWISRLSARNAFWQRVCSLIWLPMAFRSGIRMKRIDPSTFTAVLPFRRFNRNWYNAMAGAALLANSEIAGGMYVFGICGGDYEVVCKRLQYKFLRPCFGPAVYRVQSDTDIAPLAESRQEFNVELELDVVQQVHRPGSRERRVGKCVAVFHATPKAHKKAKRVNRGRRAIRG